MKDRTRRVIVYVDDGYPESREYDNNYKVVDLDQVRDLRRTSFGLPPRRPGPRREAPAPAGGFAEPLPA